jgi:peptidyl-tRNA hydrolase, PTH1 family
MSSKYLIVGLGNPGRKYQKTRHNVGFWVIDELARRHPVDQFTEERKALVADGRIGNRRVLLVKPQTYMNLSGEAVRLFVDYYNIDYEKIMIVHDDLDLPLGTLRLRKTGGAGGQNGVRNIIHHLGTKEFARARFGIGRPPGRMKARDYVLQPMTGDDAQLAEEVRQTTAEAIELWLTDGIELAMSRYNGDVNAQSDSANGSNPQDELEVARRAHELSPADPKPLEKMARLYKRMRQLDEVVTTYRKLATLHKSQDQLKQAIHAWGQVVRYRPADISTREEIALSYEELDNTKKAVQTWLDLAEYHDQQGDMDSAMASLDEALRLNPQHPRAHKLQRRFRDHLTM